MVPPPHLGHGGAQQVTQGALSTAGIPRWEGQKEIPLPSQDQSHTWICGAQPMLLMGLQAGVHVAQAQRAQPAPEVALPCPTEATKLVAMSCHKPSQALQQLSCSPACTIPWGHAGAGLDLCVCLTWKFQLIFSIRLLGSF